MFVLQRIRPALDSDRGRLYFDTNLPPITTFPTPLPAGTFLNANAYWNSFFPAMWPSNLTGSTALYLAVEGRGKLQLYGTRQGHRIRFLSSDLEALRPAQDIPVSLPGFKKKKLTQGRIVPLPPEFATFERVYWQLDSQGGLEFNGGYWLAEVASPAEVQLALAVCTYQKEAYLKQTIGNIQSDKDLQGSVKVNISDNAGTLNTTNLPPFCQVVTNHNVGGAGGFARALAMGLADSETTHLAMLDDDIELETEALFRLLTLYSLQPNSPAYAGAMLDILVKNSMYECGALFEGNRYAVRPAHHQLDISSPATLDTLGENSQYNFGGWWFFSFPRQYLVALGYPMPMFILGDDMEYSIRALRNGYAIKAMPQLGVWHEPFYAKERSWNQYYKARNYNIVHALHFPFNPFKVLINSLKEFALALLLYDYQRCRLFLMGLKDYLRGPEFLNEADPAQLHSQLTGLGENAALAEDELQQKNSMPPSPWRTSPAGKALALFTGVGHLCPPLSKGGLRLTSPYGIVGFWADYPKIYRRTSDGVWRIYERSYIKSLALTAEIGWTCLRYLVTGFFVRQAWRKSSEYLTSDAFWKTKWM